MATNKRKDAAALFELIDKSTLKVPKSAGSLRIPGWWSSKSNPQPAAEVPKAPAAAAPTYGQPKAQIAPQTSLTTEPQPRLFEPPSAARPGASPTIRPPGGSIRPPVSPAVSRPPLSPPKTTSSDGDASPQAPALSPPPSVIAPQSAPRRPWTPPKPGSFARMPAWVIVSMISGIILVICLIVAVIQNRHRATATQTSSATSGAASPEPSPTSANPDAPHSLIPAMNNDASQLPPTHSPSPVNTHTNSSQPPAPAQTVGRFSGAGTIDRNTPALIQRSGEQYYIIIASSPSEDVARRNGEFLADHGISASMETQIIEKKTWYVLVSVDGFSSYDAAEPFRKKIVQIGHDLPAYKKSKDGRQAYDTARITNKVQTAAQNH